MRKLLLPGAVVGTVLAVILSFLAPHWLLRYKANEAEELRYHTEEAVAALQKSEDLMGKLLLASDSDTLSVHTEELSGAKRIRLLTAANGELQKLRDLGALPEQVAQMLQEIQKDAVIANVVIGADRRVLNTVAIYGEMGAALILDAESGKLLYLETGVGAEVCLWLYHELLQQDRGWLERSAAAWAEYYELESGEVFAEPDYFEDALFSDQRSKTLTPFSVVLRDETGQAATFSIQVDREAEGMSFSARSLWPDPANEVNQREKMEKL